MDPLHLKGGRAEALRGDALRRFLAWRDRIDALRAGNVTTVAAADERAG